MSMAADTVFDYVLMCWVLFTDIGEPCCPAQVVSAIPALIVTHFEQINDDDDDDDDDEQEVGSFIIDWKSVQSEAEVILILIGV